jgi:hypothetical protein
MANIFHILFTYPPINTLITYADKKELLYNCSFILDNVFIDFIWLDHVVKKFQDWWYHAGMV